MEKDKRITNIIEIIKKIQWLDIAYLFILTLYFGYYYLNTTALTYDVQPNHLIVLRYMLIGYIVVKLIMLIILKKFNYKIDSWLLPLLIIVSLLIVHFTDDKYILDLTLLCIGAKDVPFKKIAIVYLIVAIEIQVIAYYCATHGIAPNYIYYTERGVRRSYGICYPTDYAAHVLFIILAYSYVRGKKLTFCEITLIGVISYIVYRQSLARNDFACSILLVVLLLLYKIWPKNTAHRAFRYGVAISCVLFAVGIIALTIMYNQDNAMMVRLDTILSSRLSIGKEGITNYGITFFGKPIYEAGNGFGGGALGSVYFFLDSSYLRILLKYGIVGLVAVLSGSIFVVHRFYKLENGIVLVILSVIFVFGIAEHHMLEIAYNPFILMMFSKAFSCTVQKRKESAC